MIYFTVSQVCCPSLKGLFIRNLLKQQQKKKMVREKRVPKKKQKTFHVHIGTVKFATQFNEYFRSPVVTFQNFGSEGHGVQPPQGDFVFFIFLLDSILFSVQSSFFWFNQVRDEKIF